MSDKNRVMSSRLGKPSFEDDKEYFWRYFKDTGCDLHPACLDCPRSQCKYDEPYWERKQSRVSLDAEILQRAYSGEESGTIAKSIGVSVRTVQRAIKRSGDPAQQGTYD